MPWLLLAVSRLATASCECGYSLNSTTDSNFAVFTDLIENDFLHTTTENLTSVGWRPQLYNVSAKDARGPFGKDFQVENVETNPLKDKFSWAGEAENGGDAGLRLWVRGDHSHGYVEAAELASVRDDQLYGSFRIGMKLAGAGTGTCGAFFWFYNNSQEIDMEFLSKQFNNSQGAVNLVLQTPASLAHGYDASGTDEFRVAPLPFRPDDKFHEYRFDWTPNRVSFYVDGNWLYEMTENIPTEGGRMFLNHWSNGDPLWSAGPPSADTAMTVSYVKAYFNSTEDARKKAYTQRCANWNATSVCAIPAQTVAPDNSGPEGNKTARTYFFTQDQGKAPGQEIFKTNNNPHSGASGLSSSLFTYAPLFAALISWAFVL